MENDNDFTELLFKAYVADKGRHIGLLLLRSAIRCNENEFILDKQEKDY